MQRGGEEKLFSEEISRDLEGVEDKQGRTDLRGWWQVSSDDERFLGVDTLCEGVVDRRIVESDWTVQLYRWVANSNEKYCPSD